MKALHSGFVSAAVWNAIRQEKLSAELDWKDILNRLSHFVIDGDLGGGNKLAPTLSILENILCRGLPTLPSLFIEKELERLTGLFNSSVVGNPTISAFKCEINPDLADSIYPLLETALCVASPEGELTPSSGYIFPDFGCGEISDAFESKAEEQFWNGPLKNLLGPGGIQLALRQRKLNTIIGDDFKEQRADISVQFPGSRRGLFSKGIVLEVDGPSHKKHSTQQGDARRDEACNKMGWAETYRHQLWNNTQATEPIPNKHPGIAKVIIHPYLRRVNENITKPLTSFDVGYRALYLALFPIAVARIQRVILELVRGGVLSLDAMEWNVVILDRDCLSGCGTAAAEDLMKWMERIFAIYQPSQTIPIIKVHEIAQNETSTTTPCKVDVLLDLSVQLRYGVSLPTPSSILSLGGIPRVVIRTGYFNTDPYPQLSFADPLAPQIKGTALEKNLVFFLQNIFRKESFREKQTEIIMRALRGESVIALLPTGAGKSITYQLATLLQNGIAIVVDPIKSLMKDQVDNLEAICISSAYISSMNKDAKERRHNIELMRRGCLKFVFVSPERFIIQEFRDALENIRKEQNVHFAYVVVDEAHCVSEWGHDFRTAYLRLGKNSRNFCSSRFPELPLLALTGTASLDVLDDVAVELGYEKNSEITVQPKSMKRDNLIYRVVPLNPKPDIPLAAVNNEFTIRQAVGNAKLASLPAIIENITQDLAGLNAPDFLKDDNGSGLVFCPHARNLHGAQAVQSRLISAFESVQNTFGIFHGSPDEGTFIGFDPIKAQDDFKKGSVKVLACTKAFGMGIDKPDIRFTLHYNIPPSLESFYQEAGRAGRDGNESLCWVLYAGTPMPGKTPSSLDYSLNHSFYRNSFPGAELEEAKLNEILDENRVPGSSTFRKIEAMLLDNTEIELRVNLWHSNESNLFRLYINHPEFHNAKVYVNIFADDRLVVGTKEPFPEHVSIGELVKEWIQEHQPADKTIRDWLWTEESVSVARHKGIEEMLNNSDHHQQICLSFDNGYLEEIAERFDGADIDLVRQAYAFVNDANIFISNLESKKIRFDDSDKIWIANVFPKIRLTEHTFKAVYRLTILGAVNDYVVDYAGKTITATLQHSTEGEYRVRLHDYIHRYAPQDTGKYLDIADQSHQKTELRRCIHALIHFVYGRIAKQRVAAMEAMERATVRAIQDPSALAETVTDYF
ncbi:MAG: ATP-dependent DNA helicase RecQ, partial [Desulfobulbaceae bacterium]|nr:ATP-dependent DNA helicase RecQ [Desulfobulbaceae bacterium]